MSQKFTNAVKSFVLDSIARLFSKSYYLTQIARRVVQFYDNDCNPDMQTNGELLLIKQIVARRNNGVFFDVGANKGDWCAEVLGQGFKGKIIAIDPLQSNIALIKQRFSNTVMPIQYAISDSIGEATFFSNLDASQSGTDSLHNMTQIGYAPSLNEVNVNCTTIDKISDELQINKIDFLKVDVEGHEYFVLKGADRLLKNGAIDYIQIEFGHAARAAKVYLHDIVKIATKNSYDLYVIKCNGFMPLNFTPFTENRYSYVNLLLARKAAANELERYILRN